MFQLKKLKKDKMGVKVVPKNKKAAALAKKAEEVKKRNPKRAERLKKRSVKKVEREDKKEKRVAARTKRKVDRKTTAKAKKVAKKAVKGMKKIAQAEKIEGAHGYGANKKSARKRTAGERKRTKAKEGYKNMTAAEKNQVEIEGKKMQQKKKK